MNKFYLMILKNFEFYVIVRKCLIENLKEKYQNNFKSEKNLNELIKLIFNFK